MSLYETEQISENFILTYQDFNSDMISTFQKRYVWNILHFI